MADAATLTVKGITKSFGGTKALYDVSFSASTGQVLAIIGPNGAGKSTLLHIVAGQTKPDAGQCHFDGHCLTSTAMHVNARRGVIQSFQDPRLFNNLTVEENILAACGGRDQALRMLGRFDLKAEASLKARQLSYGQQKLVAFARALSARPRLLLLDEPSTGLAKHMVQSLTDMIREARASAAIVVVEHDIDFVREIADQVIVLQGTVVTSGEKNRVLDDREVVRAYLGRLYA